MKEFKELCKRRHSIRKFSNKVVEDKDIREILNVVNMAPSAGNLQAYEVLVVQSIEVKKRLAESALNQSFIIDAPKILVFVAWPDESSSIYGERGENLYCIQDATIACTYAMLAAESLGLSSTWVGAFKENMVREILELDNSKIPVAILPIGYKYHDNIFNADRKSLEELYKIIEG